MENRKIQERAHNRKILGRDEEAIWGWQGPAGQLRLKRRAELINDFITSCTKRKGPATINILELGCGTGAFTEKILRPLDENIVSMDIYEGFVRKACDRLRRQDRKNIFLVGDAENLPFLDGTFDIVFGVSILHHLHLEYILKEIKRVLKPDGQFIFSEPNMLNPQICIQKNVRFIKKYFGDSPSETAFFPGRLRDSFGEHNLNVKIVPFDFLHPRTPKPFISAVERIGGVVRKPRVLKIHSRVFIDTRKKYKGA